MDSLHILEEEEEQELKLERGNEGDRVEEEEEEILDNPQQQEEVFGEAREGDSRVGRLLKIDYDLLEDLSGVGDDD